MRIVVRLRDPRGRPDFRFRPCETSWFLSFLAAKNTPRAGAPRPRNKKPGAVSRPGVSAQFW
jgi:hypothetical protein